MTDACRHRTATLAVALGIIALPLLALPVRAQQGAAWVPERGHGSMSVSYQHLYVRVHTDSHGNRALPGTIRNRSVLLDFDYGLTDRLALSASVAYKSNRYDERIPGTAHDPDAVDHDHGEVLTDDGRYHAGWQDWNVALRYKWIEKPFMVTPYLAYGRPMHDYATFAHSAAGTGQSRLEAGINTGGRLPGRAQNFYWQVSYGYAYMQERDHRRVNHSTLSAELGYFVNPRVAIRATISGRKTYNGLDFPEDYVGDRHSDTFFHHDQNVRNDFINVGVGASYQFSDRYTGYANVGRTVWSENSHPIDYAITVGISRSF